MTENYQVNYPNGYEWPEKKSGVAETTPTDRTMTTFTVAVNTFLDTASWLTAADAPAVTALQQAAKELDDNGVSAALLNVFTVTFRGLSKRQNNNAGPSEAEAFLDAL